MHLIFVSLLDLFVCLFAGSQTDLFVCLSTDSLIYIGALVIAVMAEFI